MLWVFLLIFVGQAVFIPKGLTHVILTGCDELELLMFYNHEDYGVVNPISRAKSFPMEILEVIISSLRL